MLFIADTINLEFFNFEVFIKTSSNDKPIFIILLFLIMIIWPIIISFLNSSPTISFRITSNMYSIQKSQNRPLCGVNNQSFVIFLLTEFDFFIIFVIEQENPFVNLYSALFFWTCLPFNWSKPADNYVEFRFGN